MFYKMHLRQQAFVVLLPDEAVGVGAEVVVIEGAGQMDGGDGVGVEGADDKEVFPTCHLAREGDVVSGVKGGAY